MPHALPPVHGEKQGARSPNPDPNQERTTTCPDQFYECGTFADAPHATSFHELKFCSSVGELSLHVTTMGPACVVRHEEGTIVRALDGTFVGMRLPETLSTEVVISWPVSSEG